jgi:four helix bundle protein
VKANLVEGYALGTPGLFRRHLRIALGSAAEVETLLDLAIEANQLKAADVRELLHDVNELVAVLRGLLKSQRKIGPSS